MTQYCQKRTLIFLFTIVFSLPFQVLEYIIVHIWNEKEELLEEFSTHKGTLVVFLDIEDSVQNVGQSYCATVSK